MDLVPQPSIGRRFVHRAHVGLGDTAPDGRARFDALARWLQDAAYADAVDAGLHALGAWVVRRARIEVRRFPRFDDDLELVTWCSGLGRMWAERRTSIAGALEAVGIWIYVDPATGRPRPFEPEHLAAWEPSTGGRRVKARLRHGDPGEDVPRRPWVFRRADLDIADHVNNAAYWEILEEIVPDPPEPASAEIEFRGAASAGPAEVLGGEGAWWVAGPTGELHASLTLGA